MKRIFEVCQKLGVTPGSAPSLFAYTASLQFILESPTKVKQRQVDRLNKSPPEFNDQPLAAGTNFPLCGNITTATK